MELAAYSFSDSDILRRALPHLDRHGAHQIIGLIHAVRAKYHLTRLLDPNSDRPFQPGGTVLPGRDPAARDLAFGEELSDKLPALMKGRIDSIEAATRAADQLLKLDPWSLKIGVPFNRFSEDKFHGNEHASLAHWIPDLPRVLPVKFRRAFFAVQDRYLRNPSDKNLWSLIKGFQSLTQRQSESSLAYLSENKMTALMLLQHRLRQRQLGIKLPSRPISFISLKSPMVPNPAWEVGEIARQEHEGGLESAGAPERLKRMKTGGPSFRSQTLEIQTAWLWLGWLFDQGLNRTTRNTMSARGDWLAIALWNGGPYPIHNVYCLARKQQVANFVPGSWGGRAERQRPEWDYLALQVGGRYRTSMPTEPRQRRLYLRLAGNCFRMSLYQMLKKWGTERVVWYRRASLQHIDALIKFLVDSDPESALSSIALKSKLYKAIDGCQERV